MAISLLAAIARLHGSTEIVDVGRALRFVDFRTCTGAEGCGIEERPIGSEQLNKTGVGFQDFAIVRTTISLRQTLVGSTRDEAKASDRFLKIQIIVISDGFYLSRRDGRKQSRDSKGEQMVAHGVAFLL
jgi:hypothetical protein